MTTENQTVPPMDHDGGSSEQSEQALFDAVLQSSEFFQEATGEESLPEEQEYVDDTVESDVEDDLEESEEIDTEEEYEEEEVEAEDEDGDEESPTQEDEVYTADDLDLDAKVRVKIDGEELDVSFADLLKGYQTDASISKKGRELGEAKKQLEEERAEALAQVQELGVASTSILMGHEQKLSKEYHEIEKKIEDARESGDTYEVSELKDKREQVQKKYWKARKEREGLVGQLQQQKAKLDQEAHQKKLDYFYENIHKEVPDFDENVAKDIRDFAIGEGLPEEVVDSISDPIMVRLMNDYRKLKQGVTKGQAKRKAVPAKKAIPAKKGKSTNQKKADKAKMTKARAFKEDASREDQMAFLRDYASKSLGNM